MLTKYCYKYNKYGYSRYQTKTSPIYGDIYSALTTTYLTAVPYFIIIRTKWKDSRYQPTAFQGILKFGEILNERAESR